MNTKQVFIILVATSFLVVSIGGAQAGTTVRSSKSNSSDFLSSSPSDTGNSPPSNQPTKVKSSKSNASERGIDPTTKSINLNSSRSNTY
jgi:hypothetical protein